MSAANAGNTQYPPYFARFIPYSPAFVAANFFAVLSASFVFAALPNNLFAIFCATAKPVPYCVNSDVNFVTPPALSPYISSRSISGNAFCTLSNVSVSKYKSDNADMVSAVPLTAVYKPVLGPTIA